MNATFESSAMCPYDLCAVDASDCVVCPGCSHSYHRECWQELGGCAVMGCPNMVEVKKPEIGTPTFWGATEKTCPFCAETIPVAAVECPFCKSPFEDVRPISQDAILPRRADPLLEDYRRKAKWLLFFSVIGFTSPLVLLIGTVWYRRNRKEIAQAGTTTNALVIAALGISVVYLIMLSIGALAFQIGHQGR